MEFRKKMEEEATDAAVKAWAWADRHLKEKFPSIAYEHGVRSGFFIGAIWSREETLKEVIAWVRGGDMAIWIDGGEHDGEIDPDALADAIKQRFMPKEK